MLLMCFVYVCVCGLRICVKKDVWDRREEEEEEEIERSEDVSKRLAVCNLDWENVSATDILVLFSSFISRSDTVESVDIYMSEFGKERTAIEDVQVCEHVYVCKCKCVCLFFD
eukprot:m.83647 g.83647  ORF g.83647 m.83647 type:complete len:113 (+) comp12129_c1_seq4:388-726(+)